MASFFKNLGALARGLIMRTIRIRCIELLAVKYKLAPWHEDPGLTLIAHLGNHNYYTDTAPRNSRLKEPPFLWDESASK